jgi:hypothetical protein
VGEINMGQSTFQRVAAICACTLLFSASTANAGGFVSGNDLYRICRGTIDEQWNCIGYLQASADAMEALRVSMGKPECLRQGVELGQIKDVVLKYLEANPQARDENAWPLVVAAIGEALGLQQVDLLEPPRRTT